MKKNNGSSAMFFSTAILFAVMLIIYSCKPSKSVVKTEVHPTEKPSESFRIPDEEETINAVASAQKDICEIEDSIARSITQPVTQDTLSPK